MAQSTKKCRLPFLLPLSAAAIAFASVQALAEPSDAGLASHQSEWLIQNWETADGLPENSATAIAQSPDGYLWFGTFDGLVRFDGVKFTILNHKNTPQLPSSSIVNLHLDKRGRLWVSTYEGLVMREGEQWRVMTKEEVRTGDIVRSFVERSNGDLLLTKFNGKVMEFTDGQLKELPDPPGDAHNGYLGCTDEGGQWWVVQYKFVGRWDGHNWVPAISLTNLSNLTPQEVGCAQARDGGFWLLLGPQLRKYSHDTEVSRIQLPEPAGGVWSMSEDSRGNVWICTHDRGLCEVSRDGRMRRWDESNGLPYHGIRFAFEDRESDLWIGTSGGGLVRLKPRRFKSFGIEAGLGERVVKSVWPAPAGGLWIATYGQGLFRLGNGGITNVLISGWTDRDRYGQSVLTDKTGRTWVGTLVQGLWLSGQRGFERVPDDQARGNNFIALFEDSRGRIWLSGGNAVSVFESGTFRGYGPEQGVPLADAQCFGEDREGVLWLSNRRGLFRLENDHFLEVRDATKRPISEINFILGDKEGGLWLGSENEGLLRWRNGSLARIAAAAGLVGSSIQSIIQDQQGFFWITSNRGVLHARRNDLEELARGKVSRLSCEFFDLSDGLPSVEFSMRQPACAQDAGGRLWFATAKGVAMTDPSELRINTLPPSTQIEELIYYSDSKPGAEESTAEQRVKGPVFPDRLDLPPGSRRFEIRYTAPSLASPEKVRFEIQLDGTDKDWREVGNRRMAYFDNVGPGKHIFRVRATNGDGACDETGASLGFTILPLFWQTAWFRALEWLAPVAEGLLILALLRAMARRRLARRELDERLRFEQLVSEVSNSLINQPAKEIETKVVQALGRVTTFLGLDVAKLSLLTGPKGEDPVPLAWKVEQLLEVPVNITEEEFPWSAHELKVGHDLYFPSLDALPPEAQTDRVGYGKSGVRSIYHVPLLAMGEVIGSLGLFAVSRERRLPIALLERQRLIGEVFANALTRRSAENRLRESEARFRIMADAAPVLIWMSGVDKLCTYFNKPWLDFTGRTLDQEMGNGWADGVHPEDLPSCLKGYAEAFDARKAFLLQYRLRRHDGEYRWIADTGVPRYDAHGNFTGYVGSCVDVTERKRAEQKFRLAIESSPLAIVLMNQQGQMVLANRRSEQLFGFSGEELIGQSIEILLAQRFRHKLSDERSDFFGLMQTREMGRSEELLAQRKDGTEFQIEMGVSPIQSEDELLGLITILDVTEQRRQENALRESEERMNIAAEAANLGMWVWDCSQDFIWATGKLRQIFGFTPDSLITVEAFNERIHPGDRAARKLVLQRALEKLQGYHLECRLKLSDGTVRWIASHGRAESERDGKPRRLLGVCIDISERRRMEEEAQELSGRLISAQEDERSRLARDLHDEFSQKLALLAVDLDLFGQHPPEVGPGHRARVDELSTQVRELSSEAHRLSYELHPSKLEQLGLTAAMHGFCKEISAAHQLQVGFEARAVPRKLPGVVSLCLYRIGQEALQNVVKHSGACSAKVELSTEGNQIHLTVVDDGMGFDVQAAQTKGSLGLISMRERARLARGQITWESRKGFTRMEVRVPLSVT